MTQHSRISETKHTNKKQNKSTIYAPANTNIHNKEEQTQKTSWLQPSNWR